MSDTSPQTLSPWIENRPSGGRRAINRDELWRHRRIARFLAARDLTVRYKQAVLGISWAVIRPLIGALVLTLVFGRVVEVDSDGIAYITFALVGYSTWSYLSGSCTAVAASLVANSELITKVYFPRLLVPTAALLPGLVDLAVSFLPLAVAMVLTSTAPGIALVTLPIWIAALVAAAFGPGLLFATLNVRYRDAGALLGVILQLLFFLSPVAYSASEITGSWRFAYALNPVVGLVGGMRWCLVDGPWPGASLISSALSTILLAAIGLGSFLRAERRFADVI